MNQKEKVTKYVKEKFKAQPDFPFHKYPQYAVFRHVDTDKWFALFMVVEKEKLGLKGQGEIDILDVKCRPEHVGSLRGKHGFLPAYHMSKEHWITVLLDGSVSDDEIHGLIDESFELTE